MVEKLDFLIEYLLKEDGKDLGDLYGLNELEKKRLYRALVNIREPKDISPEFLKVEDEYLQEELKAKDITNIYDIKTINEEYKTYNIVNANKICLWQGDITKLNIEAIVNAGNLRGLRLFCSKP